jgi:hypothetical protein
LNREEEKEEEKVGSAGVRKNYEHTGERAG